MIEFLDCLRVLLATLVFAAALAGLGRVFRGNGGTPAADLAVGLGVLGLGAMLLVRLGLGLGTAVWTLFLLGLIVFFLISRPLSRPGFARIVALLHFPIVALTAAIPLVAWDDFSHWLPNALFLLRWDAFPGPGLPPPESQHGTYPPGSALITYSTALIGRTLLGLDAIPETAAPIVTVLLFGALAACLGQAFAPRIRNLWSGAALALLCVFWANPGFIPRIVFTNYGDAPTAALLGIALIVSLYGIERRDVWSAVQASIILAAIVNVKQTGIVVALLGFGGISLIILRDAGPGRPKRLAVACLALFPAFLAWLLWRHHASAATGGFSVKPLAEWAWHLAPQTLSSMGKVAFSKAIYTSALVGAAIFALLSLKRGNRGLLASASIVLAFAGFGWAFALFMSYVGTSFSEVEITRAASFWRYMSQFAGPVGVVLALAVVEWRALWVWLDSLIAKLPLSISGRAGLVLPIAVLLLPVLAFNHLWPLPREPAPPLRRAALELRPIVQGPDPVLVVDPRGNAMTYVALSFGWRDTVPTRWFGDFFRVESFPADELRQRAQRTGARFIMITSTDGEVERAFDTGSLRPQQWRLLRLEGETWRMVAEGGW